MGFSRPEYWSGWPFPSPGDLPNPGTELRSPALQVDSLPVEPLEKNQIKVNLALFSVWEDAKVWAHWNHSFDMHLTYLGRILDFHLLSFLRTQGKEGLQSDDCWMAGILFIPEFPQGSWLKDCHGWWLWHPLFTDLAGNIPFLRGFSARRPSGILRQSILSLHCCWLEQNETGFLRDHKSVKK